MATPTFTLLNHTLLADANTATNWTTLTTLDPDVKVEGSNAVSGIFRADAVTGYYTAASAPVTASGKTFRGWILTNNLPYMEPEANGGYELLVYDGTNTEYKTMFGQDTYPGGWFNIVWDMDTFTTLTAANVRRWGFRAQHSVAAKNVVNTWADVMRYLDGYSMVGGTSGDKVRLSDIAILDKTSAYGVTSNYEGVYFATGTIQFGTGATTHYFEMDGQVLVFIQKPVKAGLYKISGVGSGTNILIKGSVLRSTGTTDATRFIIDFSDTNLASMQFTNNLVVRASTIAFKSGQTCTGNTFDNCGQITHGGADMRFSSVRGYEGAADSAALVYNVNADPSGEMDGMSFTKGTAATHAISFGTTSPTTVTLNDIAFSGYNASNGQNDSTLYFARTSGTVTVNLSGVTGNVSYKSAGATISLVNSTTLELTGLKNPTEVRIYDPAHNSYNLLTENMASGTDDLGDVVGFSTANITISSHTAYAFEQSRSVRCVSTATGENELRQTWNDKAFVQGDVVTAVGRILRPTGGGSWTSARVRIYWWNSGGTNIGTSDGTAVTIAGDGIWYEARVTGTAPANTAYGSISWCFTSTVIGDIGHWDAMGQWEGSGGQWELPSGPPCLVQPYAIAGQEDVTTGTFSTGIDAATYPSVDIAIISLGYQNIRLLEVSTTSDVSIPIQQTIDRQYKNP